MALMSLINRIADEQNHDQERAEAEGNGQNVNPRIAAGILEQHFLP